MPESMLDNDQYKIMMQQAALLLGFANVPVEYKYKCRTKNIDLLPAQNYLNEGINKLFDLRMKTHDLDYLESMRYVKPEYLSFMKNYRYEPQYITTDFTAKSGWVDLDIRIKGPFFHTTLFEVPVLFTISEAWSRLHETETSDHGAMHLAEQSLQNILDASGNPPDDFYWADFGTRRRKSFEWQRSQVSHMASRFPKNFVGTSNLHLAREFNIKPIGTQAHEWYQLHQQLDYRLINFQKAALENWVKVYRGDLGIALADIINTDAFLKDFNDTYFCKLFDGVREDSEKDPIKFGHKIANFYLSKGINPRTKTIVFSNNLTFKKAYEIWEELHNIIGLSFGIGTHITHNFADIPALNIVIKMVQCNNQPVAKISNSPGKGMCESPEFVSYLKSVFDVKE